MIRLSWIDTPQVLEGAEGSEKTYHKNSKAK
jgi:hypothetical protein